MNMILGRREFLGGVAAAGLLAGCRFSETPGTEGAASGDLAKQLQGFADQMLTELRKVIPAFLVRVDQPDRGDRWSEYLADARREMRSIAGRFVDAEPDVRPEVTLTEFDPDGEVRIVAAALYAVSELPDDQLMAVARRMTPDDRADVLRAYVGRRTNRRHRPGRAFERAAYRFDVDIDVEKNSFRGSLEWIYDGPQIFYSVSF